MRCLLEEHHVPRWWRRRWRNKGCHIHKLEKHEITMVWASQLLKLLIEPVLRKSGKQEKERSVFNKKPENGSNGLWDMLHCFWIGQKLMTKPCISWLPHESGSYKCIWQSLAAACQERSDPDWTFFSNYGKIWKVWSIKKYWKYVGIIRST